MGPGKDSRIMSPLFLVAYKNKSFRLLYQSPKKEEYEEGTRFFRVDKEATIEEIWWEIIKEI